MVDALTALLAGGKRLRPAFAYWGWRGAGGDPAMDDMALRAAAGLEFLQACALIHDDVMDGSDTRRGLPSAHRASPASTATPSGSARRRRSASGRPSCSATCACRGPTRSLFGCGFPPEAMGRAKARLRRDAHRADGRPVPRPAGAGAWAAAPSSGRCKVVRYKSAKYTIERPLHLGAALAGDDPAVRDAYSGYGLPLGEAFQLRDDILGVFGDPAETGKPAGDDLREGKRTVLIAIAVERSTPAQAAVIRRHLGDPGLDATGVDALREIIAATGALDYTEALIAELLEASLASLAHDRRSTRRRTRSSTGLAYAATRRTV